MIAGKAKIVIPGIDRGIQPRDYRLKRRAAPTVNPGTTPRVDLEPLTAAHAAELFYALSDPAIYAYIPDQPPASLDALTERYRRLETRASADGTEQWLNWAVRRIEDRQCVGYVQATIYPETTADFAYVLAPPFWGLGLAREASEMALSLLFGEFQVPAVFATVDKRNIRSTGLLTRLGFERIPPAAYPHGEVLTEDDVFRLKRAARAGDGGAD